MFMDFIEELDWKGLQRPSVQPLGLQVGKLRAKKANDVPRVTQ